jgi:site-specific recombinase XerD
VARLLKIDRRKVSTWEECLKDFETFKLAQGLSEKTIKDYQYHINRFFKEFPLAWNDYETLSKSIIKFFANGNHYAPATHNIRRKYLKSFFSWTVQEGIFPSNPIDCIKQRREEPRVRDLDEEKLRELLSTPDKTTFSGFRDYVLMCLSIDTGIRPKEALSLLPKHFNLLSREVHVPAIIAKTRVSRTLPITPLTVDGIRKLISVRLASWKDAPLFCSAEGEPMITSTWTHRLDIYSRKLGFKVSAYDLRHVFALLFLRNGGHALALQRTLGHVDLTMTQRYVALTQQDLHAQHELASPLQSLVKKKERVRKLKGK